MNINLTLIGQSIAFIVFVWFSMKFIWPPVIAALEERKKNIADGLAAAERGRQEQALSEKRSAEVIREAKGKAAEILAGAEKRGAEIVDEAKSDARLESERIVSAAQSEIDTEINRAREQLRGELATLVTAAAGQILGKEVDADVHSKMLDELATQL
jgi:F-type H+-transporting ATPase subunit b